MAASVDTILTTDGIANVNFFNDRILTAEDMRDLATADAAHRRVIGKAMGEGIASGLRVTLAGTTSGVDVTSGVAINSLGEFIHLPVPVTVDLATVGSSTLSASTGGLFAECAGVASDTIVVGGAVYLLTIRPASQEEGEAPRSSLDGVGSGCGPRYTVEGVRFRRLAVPLGDLLSSAQIEDVSLSLATPAGRGIVRSLVAHLYLGSPWLYDQLRDPFTPAPLRAAWTTTQKLEPCEVPLAIVGMRGDEIAFIDEFGVRRPPLRYDDASARGWDNLIDTPRKALGLAAVAQFQTQLAERLADGEDLRAVDEFRYLPSVGLLPIDRRLFGEEPTAPSIPFFTRLDHRTSRMVITIEQVEEALRSGSESLATDLAFGGASYHVFGVEGSEDESGDVTYKLFVHDGHWLSTQADFIDVRTDLASLRARLDDIDPDIVPPVSIRVSGPKTPTPIKLGEIVPLEFRVKVSVAGSYVVEPPTITFTAPRSAKPVTMIARPEEFTTQEAETQIVTVAVRWDKRGSGPLSRLGIDDSGVVIADTGRTAAESNTIETVLDERLFLGGGSGATARREIEGIIIRQPQATSIGTVRLVVSGGDSEASDFAEASLVFSQ